MVPAGDEEGVASGRSQLGVNFGVTSALVHAFEGAVVTDNPERFFGRFIWLVSDSESHLDLLLLWHH